MIANYNECSTENDASEHLRVYSFMILTIRISMTCTAQHACQSVTE